MDRNSEGSCWMMIAEEWHEGMVCCQKDGVSGSRRGV